MREQVFSLRKKSKKMFVVLTLSGLVNIHQIPAMAPRRPCKAPDLLHREVGGFGMAGRVFPPHPGIPHIKSMPCAQLRSFHGHLRGLCMQDGGPWVGSVGTTRPSSPPGNTIFRGADHLPLASWPEVAACLRAQSLLGTQRPGQKARTQHFWPLNGKIKVFLSPLLRDL